jgi:adenylate kinase
MAKQIVRAVFLGPPGAGKGTQSSLVAKKLGIPHVSTGDIFRAEIGSNTALGVQARAFMDQGNLVPDDITIAMLQARLSKADCLQGFILDGFPRTLPQIEALDALLARLTAPLSAIINIQVPDEVLLQRIRARAVTSGRVDDSAEVAQNRLKVFWSQTAPVVEAYRVAGRLQQVDGTAAIEQVTEQILKYL